MAASSPPQPISEWTTARFGEGRGGKWHRSPTKKIRWGHGEDHPPHLYAAKKSLKFYETQDQLPDKIETILAPLGHFTVDDEVSLFYKQFRVHGFLL
jgi:hypothetical protein